MSAYNKQLQRFATFCKQRNYLFPTAEPQIVADFLCFVADQTSRPESVIKNTSAALTCFFEAVRLENPLEIPVIKHFKAALHKSGTTRPMERSKVIPTTPLSNLFRSPPDTPSSDYLRLKSITLLALAAML